MKEFFNEKLKPFRSRKLFPYVVLVVCLSLSIYAWRAWSNSNAEKEHSRYAANTDQIVSGITERLDLYMMLLLGGRGIFATSEDVTREQWRAYYEYREVGTHFPGIQGLGFSRVIQPAELAQHIKEIKAEGFPNYSVRPDGERDVYTAIIFLEPFDVRNQQAFGYDMFSEPVRRAAMERAADANGVSISGKVTLVQEIDEDVQAGFLMYVPTYTKGMTLKSVEERRAALKGYVYSPFRMNDFMQGIFPDPLEDIDLEIYDGTELSPSTLMYDSNASRSDQARRQKPMFASQRTIDLYGRQWTLAFETRPPFEAAVDRHTSKGILAAGILISLLLFLFIRAEEKTRGRALSLAQEMTLALRQSEGSLAEAQRISSIGSWDFDISKNTMSWSDEIYRIFGYKPQEFEASNELFFSFIHPDDREFVARSVEEALNGTKPYSIDHRIVLPDGTQRVVHEQARTIKDESGNPVRMLGTVHDITERKQAEVEKAKLEERYHQAQKVEFIGRLAGGVAHDLNNMLTPILGYSEMLLDDLDPGDKRRESVDVIRRAGVRARNLVRQLLAFSSKQTLEYKLVDMNEALTGFEKLLRSTIREDIKIEIILAPDIPTVMADIGQIEQVIINLVVNAQDAMPEGGCLTIETTAVELDKEYAETHQDVKPGKYIMLAISDTGCGMDDETREHMFEPFFSTKERMGTGLGMATVYGIVKQHGGNIWVYSEPGKGATVKVYLPVSREASIEEETSKKAATNRKGSEAILLVEDNEQVRDLALAILKRQGYTVLVAESDPEALTVLEAHNGPVDLLLTDVIMPGMNGGDLFAKVSEQQQGIKVLYMSGYTDDTIGHYGVLHKDTAFIQKPFTVQALAAKVREVLDN